MLAILLLPVSLWAQQSLRITVLNQHDHSPLAGATLRIADRQMATQTDRQGQAVFSRLKAGPTVLEASYLGFKAQQRAVQLPQDSVLEILLFPGGFLAEEVIVRSTRAGQHSATTFKNISKTILEKNNLGQDLPYLLDQTPGVVTYSDAGAGVGYTGLRIRGSDPTRINVTINGIPYNDAESMGTFFVDLPDFASSIDNIQIQRGVGTSTNGAGAFGASINIQTSTRTDTAYAELNNSFGSYNTWKNTVKVGTGLIGGQFAFDGRLSRVQSDGFIDRAKSKLSSFYLSGAWYGKNSLLRANVFSGKEKTYQAWNGVPQEKLFGTAADLQGYIDANGLEGDDADNILQSDPRTYNSFLYKNQNDVYQQDHYQLLYSNQLNQRLLINGALHYTRGKGYYEEYKPGASYTKYGLEPVVLNGDTLKSTDLVRDRWLSNYFYGLTFSGDYKACNQLNLNLGGAYNIYKGGHFGNIIWSDYPLFSVEGPHDKDEDGTFSTDYRYYDNDAKKTDFNIYGKADYTLGAFGIFADLQFRRVTYNFLGYDRNLNNLQQNADLSFFNPKLGVTYQVSNTDNIYLSYAMGHKEPIGDDYENSTPDSRPKPEKMQDVELGYRTSGQEVSAGINGYAMFYRNQLILTGQINDVGAQTRLNVPDSYRLGLEADVTWRPVKKFIWSVAAGWSRNKVKNFEEYVSIYDEDYKVVDQKVNHFKLTDIALSPSLTGSSTLTLKPDSHIEVSLLSKYVSMQYLDNTQNNSRSLDAFFVNNLRLAYGLSFKGVKRMEWVLLINNIFNEKYEPNGYTYSSIYQGDPTIYTNNFYFPQAGTNFLLGMNLKF
ncbi:iron complex outermembrane recepter protein [bacterium A37T11]|nr:iron complex outermembrane recepter protein [bacterium A37T11]